VALASDTLWCGQETTDFPEAGFDRRKSEHSHWPDDSDGLSASLISIHLSSVRSSVSSEEGIRLTIFLFLHTMFGGFCLVSMVMLLPNVVARTRVDSVIANLVRGLILCHFGFVLDIIVI
jgi:hypothetical protein